MQREDLDKYLQVLISIMTDLTVNVGKTLDYLAYSKEGSVPTRLLSLEITDLREAASQQRKVCIFHLKYTLYIKY